MDLSKIQQLVESSGNPSKTFAYGTAGFRDDNALLLPVLVRVGLVAAFRSIQVGKAVGLVITASHNQEKDNGVKIVDFHGGMLVQEWELIAQDLINEPTAEIFVSKLLLLAENLKLDISKRGEILIGRDTRPHSLNLMQKCTESASVLADVLDIGVVTTPQLHFAVQQYNNSEGMEVSKLISFYYFTISQGFLSLIRTVESDELHVNKSILVDCSNGVGSLALQALSSSYIKNEHGLRIECRNIAYSGPVNENCGAEHVQKLQIPPVGVSAEELHAYGKDGQLSCSFDGDADRVVFHGFVFPEEKWVLLDGDRISCLFAMFLKIELEAAGLLRHSDKKDGYTFGAVQTAYANGSSTAFLKRNGIEVVFAKTGVKYLHKLAHDTYDCAVYFESNGHGTILFSDELLVEITSLYKDMETTESKPDGDSRTTIAIQRLRACIDIINQATGDAVSDALLCIGILRVMGMTMYHWYDMYEELVNKQVKVKVNDKNSIKCSDNEMIVIEPMALQEKLNIAMSAHPGSRCFVRPSGTEDVVRIYAEGETEDVVNALVGAATKALKDLSL